MTDVLLSVRHRAALLAFGLCAGPLLGAQTPRLPDGIPARGTAARTALIRSLDSIVTAEMALRKWPSVAVMMVRGRDTILAKGYGKADIELDVPARVDGVYWIGSVTKQFVNVAVLRLAERGVLTLDDSVGRWLPTLPWWWRGMTLKELIWHTSGIASYTGAPRAVRALITPRMTVDSTLALVRDLPPDFPRGTQMLYNNTGYILLGQVVEAATKRTLGDALQVELFTPLGLTSMHYCSLERVVPKRVTGYDRRGDQVQRAILWWPDMAAGAGALCGTVGDLVRWSEALHSGRVLRPASYAAMTSPGRLSDGTPLRYGMGVLLTEVANRRAIQHTGGIAGFTTWLAHLPDDSVHIAMTVNLMAGSERPSLAGVKLVERVLGRLPFVGMALLPEPVRRELVGRYADGPRQVVLADTSGALTAAVLGAPPVGLIYTGTTGTSERFRTNDGIVMLVERSGGRVTRVRVDGGSYHLLLPRTAGTS